MTANNAAAETFSAAASIRKVTLMYTIVCFGDTNTWGYDNDTGERLPRKQRWTGILSELLGSGFYVVEEGLPGRATVNDPVEEGKNAREHIGPCLESHEPIDVFVLMLGQPDLKRRFSMKAGDIAMGVETIARKIVSCNNGPHHGAPKLLIVSPVQVEDVAGSAMEDWFDVDGTAERSAALPGLYKDIAEKLGAYFLEASSVAETASDAIHMANSSHVTFANAVASIIRFMLGEDGDGSKAEHYA